MVDSVELAVVPVLLGSGIPLLPKGARMHLSLRSHRIYPGTGTALLEYDVVSVSRLRHRFFAARRRCS